MKKFLLRALSLAAISICAVVFIPKACAGGSISKIYRSVQDKELYEIIVHPTNGPWFAEDGGKSYYYAWHTVGRNRKDFKAFKEYYADAIENERSATTLADSPKDDIWSTFPTFGNAYNIESFENNQALNSQFYLLRVDTENKIVYTIRKNGNEYLCKFYIVCNRIDNGAPRVCLNYNWILESNSAVKNLLLPIDKQLLLN